MIKEFTHYCIIFILSVALEQFYLMQEIQKIHPFDTQIISGLENWILKICHQVFKSRIEYNESSEGDVTEHFSPNGKNI